MKWQVESPIPAKARVWHPYLNKKNQAARARVDRYILVGWSVSLDEPPQIEGILRQCCSSTSPPMHIADLAFALSPEDAAAFLDSLDSQPNGVAELLTPQRLIDFLVAHHYNEAKTTPTDADAPTEEEVVVNPEGPPKK